MPLMVVATVVLVLLLIVLTRALVLNALAIKRDVNTRFNNLRMKLERDANSVLDDFLTTKHDH